MRRWTFVIASALLAVGLSLLQPAKAYATGWVVDSYSYTVNYTRLEPTNDTDARDAGNTANSSYALTNTADAIATISVTTTRYFH